jgi:hypothetical protein
MAEKDVSEYVYISTASSSFLAPNETASLFGQYDVLFDEFTGNFNYLSFNMCVYIRDAGNGQQYVFVCVTRIQRHFNIHVYSDLRILNWKAFPEISYPSLVA